MNCEYVRNYYDVPACIGRRVELDGKLGIIAEDRGAYIGVLFDEDKPNHITPCHPVWKMRYLGMGRVRSMTRSQKRYKRYLEYGEGFESFLDYCKWDAQPEHPWNRA